MFMKINAGNNTHIVINLGQDLVNANSMVKMFENNAKFVNVSYSDLSLLTPVIAIELGDSVEFKTQYSSEEKLLIQSEQNAPTGFIEATATAFIDFAGLKKSHKEALEQKQKDNALLKAQIEVLNAKVYAFENPESAGIED